jgi:hypothetical protein
MIPRHRSFEEAVPAAPKEMVEKAVICVVARFDTGGIDEVLSPEDGDQYWFENDKLKMSVRGIDYTVNVERACWWSIEAKTLLVEKPPFKPAGN